MLDTVSKGYSACPHDCPSTCALEVEMDEEGRIGRLRGSRSNPYTDGVICAKVARYTERLYHPDRVLHPLRRVGAKGSGEFEQISWDAALDITAEALLKTEQQYGAEAVWPYFYAGTMGLLMRDGLERLRNVKKYSRQHSTICSTIANAGFLAGTGKLMGANPLEMAVSDLVVIWGTNPVNTQVNVMTHAVKARKNRGAKIAVVDIYRTNSMAQADIGLVLRPGTDGALAAALMHILFRDGYADKDYLLRYTDYSSELEDHLRTKTPEWASAITGLSVKEIEDFAQLIGQTKKSFFRLGYGFTRSRNGAANMHAASSIPAVTGAWQYEGGGAFFTNSGIYKIDKTLIEGRDKRDISVRALDQSRIGPVLCGEQNALGSGPEVKALFIQNTNPVSVAPEQDKVKQGFARDDLFVCVHEQFMTETAHMADVVLPATMFLEHDDIYIGGGHQNLIYGPELAAPRGECRSNHDVVCALAKRLGVEHEGFAMSAPEILNATLKRSNLGSLQELREKKWTDFQPSFEQCHYLDGFSHKDKKFHFKADWLEMKKIYEGTMGPVEDMPAYPDHWNIIENANERYPFRLATSPARNFLNSSFTETPTSMSKEGEPRAMIHPDDAAELSIDDGQHIMLGNERGEIELKAILNANMKQGVVIVESIFPNHTFAKGRGINSLTSADIVAPVGGAAFHDTHVWVKPV